MAKLIQDGAATRELTLRAIILGGLLTFLFTAANDAYKATTTADAICESFDELEAAIDRLNA